MDHIITMWRFMFIHVSCVSLMQGFVALLFHLCSLDCSHAESLPEYIGSASLSLFAFGNCQQLSFEIALWAFTRNF